MDQELWEQLGLDELSGGTESGGYTVDDSSHHLSADNSAGESSSSAAFSNSPQQSVARRGPIPIAPLGPVTRPAKKNKLERRGHFKSRNGCFNCKKRRIKCQETHPACGHCIKGKLKCEYPAVPQIVHQPRDQLPLFSMQDMRFFQHFLQYSFPHHPLGNDKIWTHEVPCLSYSHEFLMHSILGLAASELIATDPSLAEAALVHRFKSIQAIKRKLAASDTSITYAEGNALIATCFALTFQSVILEDGMAEYMAFIRGIIVVVIQMYKSRVDFMFKHLFEQNKNNAEILKPHIDKVTFPDGMWQWKAGALASLAGIRSLCDGDDLKMKYLQMTEDMANGLDEESPFKAYLAMGNHYTWWVMLPQDQFARIVDPSDQVFILLAANWIAIKQIMAVITEVEKEWTKKENDKDNVEEGMGRWLRYLNRQVEPELIHYNQWPMWVQGQLEMDPCFFGKATRAGKKIERSCVGGYAKLIQ
ncbi:hypothetical protein KVR01_010059 [Diaporthe batatas]|uniref:uncharacterized protein n=1 Tax=Diaporthe batatas TaxID=748121 RepID=UPI001D03924A|nr:uncharacterized protein KVR01_010059 [Diaporthe batatas]KAG8160523.1 hypothetical protein KVR01_010059 [Diaporthe batatas]